MPGLRLRASRGQASRQPSRRLRAASAGPVMAAVAIAAALLAGCGQVQQSGPAIILLSAQVTAPNASGVTDAYVIVQNKGPAVQLVAARTSAGGTVLLRSPARAATVLMRTVPAIMIPAHSLFRLDPSGSHLLITGSGPMRAGTEITLTLIFARHGAISVPAMVTDPATGGASYFLN